MGVLDFFFRRSSPARPAPQGADREIVANPYIVEVNEQLEAYMAIHRFVTTEVRDYQERENQGTPAQAALANVFFDACHACGSGTPPVELLEQTQMIFNQLARGPIGNMSGARDVSLKLGKISDRLAMSPVMVWEDYVDSSDLGSKSLAGCFADSFLYAHSVLDSVSGNQPDSGPVTAGRTMSSRDRGIMGIRVFIPAEWKIPSKAQRILDVCTNA